MTEMQCWDKLYGWRYDMCAGHLPHYNKTKSFESIMNRYGYAQDKIIMNAITRKLKK